jgi:hypothetical protein
MAVKGIANVLFFLVLIVGCEKEPSDYRDKFTGKYNFEIEHEGTYMHIISPQQIYFISFDTVFSYEGRISKSLNYDNKILIDWGRDTIFRFNGLVFTQKTEMEIDSGGILYSIDSNFDFDGYIHEDTIRFDLFLDGGMGGALGSGWIITGIKN